MPGGSNNAVAEYCVGDRLDLLRRMSGRAAEIKRGRYVEFRQRMLADNLEGLDGLTVGVVGLGTIGMVVAAAFAARGSRIVYFDPKPPKPDAAMAAGWTSLSLDALLAESDVVTLHVPLIPATTGLIGAAELQRMKKGAILVNAARGGIVDEAALAASLTSGHLGGAAVDVYTTEPPPADNPLLQCHGRSRRAPAADPAHRRRDAPVLGDPVPRVLGERRARAAQRRDAAQCLCVKSDPTRPKHQTAVMAAAPANAATTYHCIE